MPPRDTAELVIDTAQGGRLTQPIALDDDVCRFIRALAPHVPVPSTWRISRPNRSKVADETASPPGQENPA